MENENQDASSASDQDVSNTNQNQDMVAYTTHAKLLSQRKNDLVRFRDVETELAQLRDEKKLASDAKLTEQGEYKKLLEQRDSEIVTLKEANNNFESSIRNAVKLNAFKEKLGTSLNHSSYYQFVDTDSIVINPDSNTVDEQSVLDVVNKFKEEHANLYSVPKMAKLPENSVNILENAEKPFDKLTEEEKMDMRLGIVKNKFY